MGRIFVGAALAVVLASSAASAQYNPLVVLPVSVVPGGQITVSGRGCAAGEGVTVYLVLGHRAAASTGTTRLPGGSPAGNTVADPSGNFTLSFAVSDAADVGDHTMMAVCGSMVQAETIKVLGAAVTGSHTGIGPAGTDTQGGNLARAGSDLNGIGLIGAGLLVTGGLVLLATRPSTRGST